MDVKVRKTRKIKKKKMYPISELRARREARQKK